MQTYDFSVIFQITACGNTSSRLAARTRVGWGCGWEGWLTADREGRGSGWEAGGQDPRVMVVTHS